jgi:hypothetical protein
VGLQEPEAKADIRSAIEKVLRFYFTVKFIIAFTRARSFFLLQTFILFDEFRLRVLSGTVIRVELERTENIISAI